MRAILSSEGNRDIKVYNEGEKIVVKGLIAGDKVSVYSVSGMLLASYVADRATMAISAPNGHVYIVRVNNGAVKLQR